ncbi:MAG TPA: long-chain fatty acid--CoA ligase [Candidatus Acidoferrum sp.]|nr:long-chain fatty acid--CoA ligase [Candidatus Acidoferrum sp.]
MMNFPLTVNHILERAGKYFADRPIVSRRPDRTVHRYTYGDFCGRAKRLAAALQGIGLKRGDRVATLMWNHSGHLEAYFGVPFAGGVVHTLNLRLHPDEIALIANHARDRFLIVDDVLLPTFEKFRSKTNFERVIVVPFGGCKAPKEFQDYEELLASGSEEFSAADAEENDAAVMCFTSGTTGQSKGVVYSHRALVLHSFAIAIPDVMNLSTHSMVFPVSPMFHANAWGIPWASVMIGAGLVFPGLHLDAETLLDTMAAEKVTHSCAVPTVWLGVQAALEKEPERWKFAEPVRILCGGMAPPVSLIRDLDRSNLKITHGWGMTETAPVATIGSLKAKMTAWPEDRQLERRAMQGVTTPFVEVRVMRPDGEAPHDGETPGEIEIRGPWIAASYFECPEQQHRWTKDGWFKTGDIATMDEEGYLRIVDRSKDLIKSGGEWISSVDLENTLMGHPAVREAAVIGVAHPKWQERPLALVVLKENAAARPEELRAFLAGKFAKWQLPDAFVFVNELPHTSVGKLLKMKLRERYKDWDWQAQDQVR